MVPLGTYPFAAVVDLRTGTLTTRVALPPASGATGVEFMNDSIAVVANSSLNTISPINVVRGTAGAQVQVGTYPQAIVSDGARLYVLNANLVNFTPAGPGSVTVLDDQLRLVKTVQISGLNPSAAAFVGNRLYVLNSGTFMGNNGSLSVINLQTLTEESHHTGFGDFPSSIAASDEGELYVGIYGTGIVVWNPQENGFRVPIAAALKPGGSAIVAGVGFDYQGRLHTVNPGSCQTPGSMNRVSSGATVDRTVTVGICPFGLAFADVPEADED